MGKVVLNFLNFFLENKKINSNFQAGFRKRRNLNRLSMNRSSSGAVPNCTIFNIMINDFVNKLLIL